MRIAMIKIYALRKGRSKAAFYAAAHPPLAALCQGSEEKA
jgi:hypothetical protein